MTEIWEIVNPKNSDAISKEVYTKLNTIWAKEFGLVASSNFLTKDMKIDFVVNTSITFWEFYDSFFEFIDNLSTSKYLLEYI